MSRRCAAGYALVFGMVIVISVGCSKGAARRLPQAKFDSAAGAKALEMYDTNKDGKISGEELDKCSALKSAISRLDPSGKNEVTAEAITAEIQKWIDSKCARKGFKCLVKRNGQPLADATVKLIPEKFLGPAVEAGTGKTDKNGQTSICVPTPPAGMGPGFYRVVVTKEGMTIPDKYSTEAATILGIEISRDFPSAMGPVPFELKF